MKGANIPANVTGRRVLGRGLGALMQSQALTVDVRTAGRKWEEPGNTLNALSNTADGEAENQGSERDGLARDGLVFLPIGHIIANRNQPRTDFPEGEIQSLAESIKQSGLLQPIIVRRLSSGSGAGLSIGSSAGTQVHFEIVAGERRFRAAKIAGLERIPALIKQLDDREAFQLAVIENVQRSDLNPIEEAQAFHRLVEEFQLPHGEVAKLVGKDRASVANSLRLLKLDPQVRDLLVMKKLSAGHGRALLRFELPEAQRAVAKRILDEGLSVRVVEQLPLESNFDVVSPRGKVIPIRRKDPASEELESRFRRVLGTKVSLSLDEAGKGEVRIHFYSKEELDHLLERIGA